MEGGPSEHPDADPAQRAELLAGAIRALCDAWDRGEWTLAHDRALAALLPGRENLAGRRTPRPRTGFEAGCTGYQLVEDHPARADEAARLEAAIVRYLAHDGQDMCWEHVVALRACLPEHRRDARHLLGKPDPGECMRLCAVYRTGIEKGLREAANEESPIE